MRRNRIVSFVERRPKEVAGTLAGAVAGMPVGIAMGGIGIAALGGAIGLPAIAVCGLVGAGIGNRIGVGLDRPLQDQPSSKKSAEE